MATLATLIVFIRSKQKVHDWTLLLVHDDKRVLEIALKADDEFKSIGMPIGNEPTAIAAE